MTPKMLMNHKNKAKIILKISGASMTSLLEYSLHLIISIACYISLS